jgi:hypothetical protein
MIRRMKFELLLAVVALLVFSKHFYPVYAQEGTPTPVPPMIERAAPEGMDTPVDRLAAPPMPENPTQADYGAQVFYQVCMVCHGDQGQGLTDEWRGALDLEDQDCWQSRCHATNHPPDGFIFPRYVPPVVGDVMLARFQTALDLYNYINTRMPWQAAGTRSEEEYWQLTAHLLSINGVDPGPEPLNAANAAGILLRPPPAGSLLEEVTPTPTPAPPSPATTFRLIAGLAVGSILLLAGGIFIGLRLKQPDVD